MKQEVIDRVPTQVLDNGATRYGIYDENGALLRYEYIKREDEPTNEGTKINRSLFNNLQGDVYTQDRFNKPSYSGTAMILDLPLTSYETNKIVCITAPATLTNPTLNINGLGAKIVNGAITSGKSYILKYNGTSWDVVSSRVLKGSFKTASGGAQGAKTYDVGFTPDLVIIYHPDNNNPFTAQSDNEGTSREVPKVLVKGFNPGTTYITTNGFTFYDTVKNITIYWIAIQFEGGLL